MCFSLWFIENLFTIHECEKEIINKERKRRRDFREFFFCVSKNYFVILVHIIITDDVRFILQ